MMPGGIDVPVARDLDKISSMLADTLVQATITIYQSLEKRYREGDVGKVVSTVAEKSKKDPSKLYKVKVVGPNVSLYIYQGVIVGAVDDSGGLLGVKALEKVGEGEVREVEVWAVGVDVLSQELREALEEARPAVLVKPPPHGWVGQTLLGFKVTAVLSEKGAFSYVLLATAPWGETVAIKVARDRSIEGRPMAVGGGSSVVYKLASEATVMQRMNSVDERTLRNLLQVRGHPPALAERLIKYKENVIRVYAVYTPFMEYDDEETYFLHPPMAVMEKADGDLSELLKERKLSQDEAVELARNSVAGALALAHSMGIGHFDIKPANILYKRAAREGLTLKLSDFSGYNSVDGRYLVDVLTPEYGDPYAIASGGRGASLASDVYNYASFLLRLHKGTPSPCIWALNAVLLQRVTGMPVMQDKLALLAQTGVEARRYVEKVRAAILGAPRGIRVNDLIARVEPIYNECISKEVAGLPSSIRGVIEKSLRLHPTARYRDMVEVYRALHGL